MRAKGINHMLQSATYALKASMPEKTILACLLHDIANAIFIKSDHGYRGRAAIEPYVDEEVSWAVRAHQ
jgi:predicted HD phosphohydrolase